MNFIFKTQIGEHSIYSYDTNKFKLVEYFNDIFKNKNLEDLHLICDEFLNKDIDDISNYETSLHKVFYKDIKERDEFKKLYCNLIKSIHTEFFRDEKYLIYQSFPSVRFQFPNNVAIPPHYDSDDLGKHPIGEKNFLIPITSMYKSKRLFIETFPGKKDYTGIDLSYGEIFFFNGNKCTHFNEKNTENSLRISLDFRIMLQSDYITYINNGVITTTNPRDPEKKRNPTKMIIGGYYQITDIIDSIDTMTEWYFQKSMIIQSRPVFDENEAIACYNYMKEDNFVTEFKQTTMFEYELSKFIGTKHCILTTSGNSAIILALMALDLKEDDEIIVPNYTMIATINSIKMVNAKPVIVDVDNHTSTISLDTIKSKITKNTKAIIHVSLNNRHKNISEIQSFCKLNNIYLIEDAAQSLGCFVNDKHFGTFGIMGCFSLSTPKIISTGQGGFIVTDDDTLASKIRMIKNFGRREGGIDIFETFGINLKFTDIQAVIGLEQLKKLPERIIRMRQIYDNYYSQLGDICNFIKPIDNKWIPWFVDIFVENRNTLIDFLKFHNIQSRCTYPEIDKTPMYYNKEILPNSTYISENGLFLPTHMKLTDEQIVYICRLIKLFYNK